MQAKATQFSFVPSFYVPLLRVSYPCDVFHVFYFSSVFLLCRMKLEQLRGPLEMKPVQELALVPAMVQALVQALVPALVTALVQALVPALVTALGTALARVQAKAPEMALVKALEMEQEKAPEMALVRVLELVKGKATRNENNLRLISTSNEKKRNIRVSLEPD